MEPWLKVWTE